MASLTESISPLQNLVLFKYAKSKIIYQSKIKTVWLVKAYGTNERYIIKQYKPMTDQTNSQNQDINNIFNENMDAIPIFKEAKILFIMQGTQGFPFIYWAGNQQDKHFIIVEQLGKSLTGLKQSCGGILSLKTICLIGLQMIKILKYLHEKCYYLGQVKQSAFSFGKSKKSHLLYINDFSKCQKIPSCSQSRAQNTNDSENWQSDKIEQKQFSPDLLDIYKVLKLLQGYHKESMQQRVSNQNAPQFEQMVKECFKIAKLHNNIIQQNLHDRCLAYLNSIIFRNNWKNDFVYDWSCKNYCRKHLRVQPTSAQIKTKQDNQICQTIFFPYQQSVQVDLLGQYKKKLQKKTVSSKKIQSLQSISERGIKEKQGCALI